VRQDSPDAVQLLPAYVRCIRPRMRQHVSPKISAAADRPFANRQPDSIEPRERRGDRNIRIREAFGQYDRV